MAVGAATSYSPLMSQLQVRQAQSEAERAEASARILRARAQSAERSAMQAQENARSLRVQSDQAQQEAGRARQNVSSLQVMQKTGDEIGKLRQQISEVTTKMAEPGIFPQPVINHEGQATGTMINTTA